ncbi:MAG: hypothetical protein QJR09_11975 [Micrococcus sp.]|nr:hypothetical protein [Micrococcus sp.]
MKVQADAEALLKAFKALAPFVATDKDAGPAGMVHLSYVAHGGLIATAYSEAEAAAWIPAETTDGDLSAFAVELADVKMIAAAFRRAIGTIEIDVQAKVLKSVTAGVQLLDGEEVETREERPETAYSITFNEGSGLFGNRLVKVSTAAQPEVNLEDVWARLQRPMVEPMPPMEEWSTSASAIGLFKPAERAYGDALRIEAATLGGSMIVRVGPDFIGRIFGTGSSAESDEHKEAWAYRLAATAARAA